MLKSITSRGCCYVDGVKNLLEQFINAHQRAKEIFERLVCKSNDCDIMVDFSENQPDNKFKGYFMFNGIILRFLPITFDIALLFPIKDHISNIVPRGVSYKRIIEKKNNGKPVKICFRNTSFKEFLPVVSILDFDAFFKLDDLGKPVYEFPDIDYLSIIDIPVNFLSKNYTLVGKQYYAPYTTDDEVYCVLFAEMDNIYDEYAIKVLRWLPTNKEIESEQLEDTILYGDVFFEMGYISQAQNSVLHSFMKLNYSRLLFGKIKCNQITLIGGIKMFLFNDLKYPKCLYNIRLK